MVAISKSSEFYQVFLAQWGAAYDDNQVEMSAMSGLAFGTAGGPFLDLPSPDVNVRPWLMIYFYISLAGAMSVFAYIGLGYYASLQASRVLFVSLLNRLSRAPARFFDITPIGRILNRFTRSDHSCLPHTFTIFEHIYPVISTRWTVPYKIPLELPCPEY